MITRRALSPLSRKPGLRVENHAPKLPEGVDREQWEVEKIRFQNPRIRCLLGCLDLIEAAHENDYTLLHCSPARLIEILRKVRLVGASIRDELRPLLQAASRIPALEEALATARASLQAIEGTALRYVHDLPAIDSEQDLRALRRALCVSISQLNSFVQDNFVRIVAADPRSQHDIDYFLSKRFPRDVEESEWLYYSVSSLGELVDESEQKRTSLARLREAVENDRIVPSSELWRPFAAYLDWLDQRLVSRLQGVLKLPGIRFDEMEILERYSADIPLHCRLVTELREVARETSDQLKATTTIDDRPRREQAVRDLLVVHERFSIRILELIEKLDNDLRGLAVFVPLWRRSLEGRRALILHRSSRDP